MTRVGGQFRLGSFHGSEIPFVFGLLSTTALTQELALSEAMMAYWTNFAKTGNPNDGTLPAWPAHVLPEDLHLQLNLPIIVDQKLRKQYCDFWDTLEMRP